MPLNKVRFSNSAIAFKTKDDRELRRSFWLFKLMKNPFLVKLLSKFTLFAIHCGLPVKAAIRTTIFKQFCGGESLEESKEVITKLSQSHIGAILDYSVEGKEKEEDFQQTKKEIMQIIQLAKSNSAIPYTSLKLTGIAPVSLLESLNYNNELSKEDNREYQNLEERLHDICYNAFVSEVPIYFDAEESWIQDAIDKLAEEMMQTYNGKKAIILTTLQMYRWDRIDYLHKLIQKARMEKFFIGIKLVRGAYMEKENIRAGEKGYQSPVHSSKEKTDRDFDKAVDICLENIDIVTLCAGTHNEESTLHLVNKMKDLHLSNDDPRVYFSQLYGMSDHITYNLAKEGYNVTKYLPYGPVKSVIPYLIRRAEENTSIAGQMGRELQLIVDEKQRRQYMKMLSSRR